MNDKPNEPVPFFLAADTPASPPPVAVTVDPNNLVGLPTPTTLPPAPETSVQTTQAPNIKAPSQPQSKAQSINATKPSNVNIEKPIIQGKSTDPVKFQNLLNQIQNDSQYSQISGMQSMATINQSSNVESSSTPVGSAIQQNEQLLKEILKRGNNTAQQNEINKAIQSLQPIFANIGDVLSFQSKEMKDNKDFYNQHYTVSPTQSVFNMTANQIMEMPSWRR